MLSNLTRNQKLALVGLLLGLLAGGGSTMTELFGTGVAAKIAAAAGFLNSFVNGAIVILSGQGQQVLDVKNMPGVERIDVNEKANQTLAKMALDPAVDKVSASTDAIPAVIETARGA